MRPFTKIAVPACALIFCLTVLTASSARAAYQPINPDGSINVGGASLFTALAAGAQIGTGGSTLQSVMTDGTLIVGNVGIGGQGTLSMAGSSTIIGDLYMNDTGTVTFYTSAQVIGTKRGLNPPGNGISQQSLLNSVLADSLNLSNAANALADTNNYIVAMGTFNGMTVNSSSSITLVGPASGTVVLHLQDFVMTGGTFTLQGTSMTTFVINVSRNFSLTNSQVVLSGGLLASHVLFNVRNSGSVMKMNQGTSLQGILLGYKRTAFLNGGKVYGKLIANQLQLENGAQIISQ